MQFLFQYFQNIERQHLIHAIVNQFLLYLKLISIVVPRTSVTRLKISGATVSDSGATIHT
jgi:hypothetical protein